MLTQTITRRQGQTIATNVGPWPVLLLSFVAVAAAWLLARRRSELDRAGQVDGVEEPAIVGHQ